VAVTAAVKDELARLAVTKTCCRRAEACALLRFASGLRIVGGRVVVQAELDTGVVARRLGTQISELYGQTPTIGVVPAGVPGPGSRYVVEVLRDGEGLARQCGLLDRLGRPVRGLASQVVSGGVCDAEAAWRGAFLARGSLTAPDRSPALEITSPGPEATLALIGAARRLGVTAKPRQVPNAERVVVRDAEAIVALLTRLGAPHSALAWQHHRIHHQARTTTHQPAAFGDANHHRATQAATEVTARVQRALEVLGQDVPEHLLVAGRLRLDHPQASLDELGRLADPPMTKDTIAGRIRRLVVLADKHTHHLQG
jgi:cell division protein WhiA